MKKIRFVKKCRGAKMEVTTTPKFSVRPVSCEEKENLADYWLRKKSTETFYVIDEKSLVENWRVMLPFETPEMFGEDNIRRNDKGEIVAVHPSTIVHFKKIENGGGRGEKRRLCPDCAKYYETFYDVNKVVMSV